MRAIACHPSDSAKRENLAPGLSRPQFYRGLNFSTGNICDQLFEIISIRLPYTVPWPARHPYIYPSGADAGFDCTGWIIVAGQHVNHRQDLGVINAARQAQIA
jgi:hypothetical protein